MVMWNMSGRVREGINVIVCIQMIKNKSKGKQLELNMLEMQNMNRSRRNGWCNWNNWYHVGVKQNQPIFMEVNALARWF
jgi:hypothetical protein